MEFQNLRLAVSEGIATLTFDRPEALNALNKALLDELNQALHHISHDEEVRALILTGAGEKAFIAGADITELATLNSLQAKLFVRQGQEIISRIQELPIPVLAAVNGFALGGGCEMALACDFIYASEHARFGLPEINLGIIPGFGGTQRLPRQIGMNLAKELIFTGKMISAAEAKDIGLVNTLCTPEELLAEAGKTAAVIAKKGRVALRAAKEAMNAGMDVDLATGCRFEEDAFAICFASEDAHEGTVAFLEKIQPNFTGSRSGPA